eukprot:4172835-Alexandrium_andersonii.AAC.1
MATVRAARQARHLAALARTSSFGQNEQWPEHVVRVHRAFLASAGKLRFEARLAQITPGVHSRARLQVAASLDANGMDALHRERAAKRQAERRRQFRERLEGRPGDKYAFKLVAKPPARRVAVLCDEGRYVTDAEGIDSALRRHWGKVYEGNSCDHVG